MSLFHCTHLQLKQGEIVRPGNWGRLIIAYGYNHICWYREIMLEAIRLQFFPSKPSRLCSTFVCISLDAIIFFRDRFCHNGFVYEVEYVNPENETHKGDFNAVQPFPGGSENMVQIAHAYWNHAIRTNVIGYEGIEFIEIVSTSAIRVINEVAIAKSLS